MRTVLRGLVGLIGLFNIMIGIGFLTRPAELAARFFLSPIADQGLATLRADFPGFFITGGTFALLGASRQDARALAVPILLLALALFGRCISLMLDGVRPEAFPPMVAEAVMVALLLALRQTLRAGAAAE